MYIDILVPVLKPIHIKRQLSARTDLLVITIHFSIHFFFYIQICVCFFAKGYVMLVMFLLYQYFMLGGAGTFGCSASRPFSNRRRFAAVFWVCNQACDAAG